MLFALSANKDGILFLNDDYGCAVKRALRV